LIAFALYLLCIPAISFAQKADQTKDILSKHPKTAKVLENILYGLSFLHYTDRKKDRILDGPEDFERFRGKRLNTYSSRF
jgi:hypothetical protein